MNPKEYFNTFDDIDFKNMPDNARIDYLTITHIIKITPDGWDNYEKDPDFKKKIDNMFRSIINYHENRNVMKRQDPKKRPIGPNRKVTLLNYFNLVNADDLEKVPYLLQKHNYLVLITDKGTDWETWETHAKVREDIDIYLKDLNEYFGFTDRDKPVKFLSKISPKSGNNDLGNISEDGKLYVDCLSHDQVIIYKYIYLKMQRNPRYRQTNAMGTPAYEEVRGLINYIRRLLVQKKIGKETRNIEIIEKIQSYLIARTKSSTAKPEKPINDVEGLWFVYLTERLKPDVFLLKRYISLSGRTGKTKASRKQLHEKADAIVEKMKSLDLSKSDSHYTEVQEAIKNLKNFIRNNSETARLAIIPGKIHALSGLDEDDNETEDVLDAYEAINDTEALCAE
jgi:hypothetical protein